jgi:Concanavalin A-like lectin/glucanases superfamily
VRQIYLHRQLRDDLLAENIGRCLAASEEASDEPPTVRPNNERTDRSARTRSWQNRALAVALLLGAFVSGGLTWQFANRWADSDVLMPEAPDSADNSKNSMAYVARLVNVTNCRWDQSRSTASLTPGSVVRSGESLHLMEGAAEINLALKNGGMATLQLEGPLAMTLNSDGMPNLLYGHLTGSFTCDFDRFTLDTPLGRVNVSSDASIGVVAAANKVELHVFTGSASLELWGMGFGGPAKQMSADGGSSLQAHAETDGRISVEHGKAKESGFLTPAARAASQLHISDKYVAAIVAAKPVAYWRFEGDVNGMMRNEMGDRLHCRIVGEAVRWHPGRDGSTVEFGATTGPGYLISEDRIESPTDSYSVELWAKPNYFHHATLFSLLQWAPPQSPVGTHRMALEMCGPVSGLTIPYRNTDFHPGRVRFVHEAQTQFDVDCFSPDAYAVRQWQHLVAVKTPIKMQMYCNGKLVSTTDAAGPLPGGVRVLMGQLLPVSPQVTDEVTSRLFSGELDEVAIYDRALSDDEVEQHFKLVHPKPESKGEVNSGHSAS